MERKTDDALSRRDHGITEVVTALCRPDSYEAVYHRSPLTGAMPSVDILAEIVTLLKGILFPGYFGDPEMPPETMTYAIGSNLDKVRRLLSEQIKRGFCFSCDITEREECLECEERARRLAYEFISRLPEIRRVLATDVQAAFEGDPAARSPGETIFCYPSIKAMTNYRIAHELHLLNVDIIPRIITEMAHSDTGIDINPGTTIGERFFIDHGTGTVIGETSIIGRNVRLYQGVTLGAKSFSKDESGALVRGIPRHPIVEDDVIIYSGTTILGRIRIGKGSVIGGNLWITQDVKPGTQVMQRKQALSITTIGQLSSQER